MRTKTQSTWYLLLCKQWLCNVKKLIKLTLNSTQNSQETQKAQKDQKTSFPKESVENADFYKPILNKIMTMHEWCVEYNFIAPLKLCNIICIGWFHTGMQGCNLKALFCAIEPSFQQEVLSLSVVFCALFKFKHISSFQISWNTSSLLQTCQPKIFKTWRF